MGTLGDLLEAMHDAPRAHTMHGRGTHGRDQKKIRDAMLRWQEQRTGRGGMQTEIFGVRGDADPDFDPMRAPIEFWCAGENWRLDQGPVRTVAAEGKVLNSHLGQGGVLHDDPTHRRWFDQFATYFRPAHWLGSFRFDIVDDAPRLQRATWHVRAHAAADDDGHRIDRGPMMMLGVPGGVLLDFELWIDQATGVIVRCEGRLDGDVVLRFEIEQLAVDEPIEPEVFALVSADGSQIRTQAEMQLEHLRSLGVDVSGMDPSDEEVVQNALREHMVARAQASQPGPPDLELLASQHMPTGPPPDNEQDALIDIGAAFEIIGKRSEDGRELVNIEGGANLGPTADEVAERVPPQYRDGPGNRVRKVKFLNPTEAVVWFDAGPLIAREGRAVFRDGAWKVSRATYCSLIAPLGVVCPPPPEPSA